MFANSTDQNEFNFGDVQLKHVGIREGKIKIKIKNPLPTNIILTVTLPGVTKNGTSFSEQVEVEKEQGGVKGEKTVQIDLSGYHIDLTGAAGDETNYMVTTVTAITDPNGPSIQISPSLITEVDVTFQDIKAGYAKGYFGKIDFQDTMKVRIDMLRNLQGGAIDITGLNMKFGLSNGVKVTARGGLLMASNTNAQGITVDLSGDNVGPLFTLNPATGTWDNLTPYEKIVTFNASNSNIEQFVENLGYDYEVGYLFQINPWGNVSGGNDEIFSTSEVKAFMELNFPIQIKATDLKLSDTMDIDFSSSNTFGKFKSGVLLLETSNAFPFSADVELKLLNKNKILLHTIQGTSNIKSGQEGSMTSSGLQVAESNVLFEVTEQIAKDLPAVSYIVVTTTFNTPDANTGQSVSQQIPVGAFLGIKLKANLKIENYQ